MASRTSTIFLTGFSGTGKSAVGVEVARLLGWSFLDIDEEIARGEGKSIVEIFANQGEDGFRRLERSALEKACQRERCVIATGGGVVIDPRNRQLIEDCGIVVCLEASPETIYRRLNEQEGPELIVRPLLSSSDPLEHIRSLKAQRQASYALAHWTVHTDSLDADEVAQEVVRAWRRLCNDVSLKVDTQDPNLAAVVRASSGSYPIWAGWGIMEQLGRRVKELVSPGVAYIISDEHLHHQVRQAQMSLEAADIPTHIFYLPPGEQSKTLGMAENIYRWLVQLRPERGHVIVAVGGGVVGDMAGYVAATILRGIPFVQVPTSLAAMVDASIGGKVAVDLPEGKNLVGAFYQPRLVLADVASLETLAHRELVSGWAEAIKHGLILDEELLRTFEEQADGLLALEPELTSEVIRRSVTIKADVVSRDEKETTGLRALLNYGHTLGHALEAATDYSSLLHGEAVSIGMMAAARISSGMGLISQQDVERQRSILAKFDLPLSYEGADPAALLDAMRMDKKTSGKAISWVLLEAIGRAVVRRDVPGHLVDEELQRLSV